MTTETAPKQTSALDDAIAAIRDSILQGEFSPQQRLVEVDLCEQLGVSRAVVRNALLKLTTEGLVEHLPNRGVRVRAITLEEAIEIVETRAALESLGARKAAQRVSPEARQHLTSLREGIVAAVESGNLAEYSALHQQLDQFIRELSGHTTSSQILERLQAQGARHQFRLSFRPGRAATSAPEHLAIIDALLAEDPDAAAAATVAHLDGVIAAMREG
ncbi:GntR family transcriptional regulator [Leucobacter aridicollis]|uniref:GntR family transcriptional regulator n=1 Tax=Leucobacter aridicollis TaxID=283878 RepID=UPI0021023A79|nr:GntR family transcriptional regulator [Leucobacter aridicollis]